MANDALAPAVGAGVVDGTGGCAFLASGKGLPLDEGQVLAQRKVSPLLRVGEGCAVRHKMREANFTH